MKRDNRSVSAPNIPNCIKNTGKSGSVIMPTVNRPKITKPYIGVLVNNKTIKKLKDQKKLSLFATLVKANQLADTHLYFFSRHDVNLRKKRINGMYYDYKKGSWKQRGFPFPHVLYRKTGGHLGSSRYRKLRIAFSNHGVKRLNYEKSYNKWDVNKMLHSLEVMQPFIPETKPFKDMNDLEKMLIQHSSVYLKAYRSGRGKKVMRVKKLSNGKYEYSYYVKKLVYHTVKSKSELLNIINGFFKGKKFIIQQAIDLITVNKGLVDLRAEVQRNGKGKLEIIGVSVRNGKTKSPITTHSNSYPIDHFFTTYLNYTFIELNELKNRINTFLENTYTSIESLYGQCGALGIDFGIDKQGHIWFIECNSRSMKVSLKNSYGKKAVRHSNKTLLEYAKYIANDEGGNIF